MIALLDGTAKIVLSDYQSLGAFGFFTELANGSNSRVRQHLLNYNLQEEIASSAERTDFHASSLYQSLLIVLIHVPALDLEIGTC